MTRLATINLIRRRAELARTRQVPPNEEDQDPAVELPEVLQTVRPRDYREISLILDC